MSLWTEPHDRGASMSSRDWRISTITNDRLRRSKWLRALSHVFSIRLSFLLWDEQLSDFCCTERKSPTRTEESIVSHAAPKMQRERYKWAAEMSRRGFLAHLKCWRVVILASRIKTRSGRSCPPTEAAHHLIRYLPHLIPDTQIVSSTKNIYICEDAIKIVRMFFFYTFHHNMSLPWKKC